MSFSIKTEPLKKKRLPVGVGRWERNARRQSIASNLVKDTWQRPKAAARKCMGTAVHLLLVEDSESPSSEGAGGERTEGG